MNGVTVTDATSDGRFLAMSLYDVLTLLEGKGEHLLWKVSNVDSVGGGAGELRRLSAEGKFVNWTTLKELSSTVEQVIEGDFEGFEKDVIQPYVVVRAVDGGAYDIYSDDREVLERYEEHFNDVTEIFRTHQLRKEEQKREL